MGACPKLWCNAYIDLSSSVFVVVGKNQAINTVHAVIDLELSSLKFYKDFLISLIYFIFNILYIPVVIFSLVI